MQPAGLARMYSIKFKTYLLKSIPIVLKCSLVLFNLSKIAFSYSYSTVTDNCFTSYSLLLSGCKTEEPQKGTRT